METMDFETLDFKQRRGGGGAIMPKNELSVGTNGKDSKKLRLNSFIAKEVEPFKYLQVKRQTMTSIDFLVFNNDKGMKISRSKDGQVGVTCKEFVEYLVKKYGNGDIAFRIKISNDVANKPDYATYQILGKADK